jgi:hypothetical protein
MSGCFVEKCVCDRGCRIGIYVLLCCDVGVGSELWVLGFSPMEVVQARQYGNGP